MLSILWYYTTHHINYAYVYIDIYGFACVVSLSFLTSMFVVDIILYVLSFESCLLNIKYININNKNAEIFNIWWYFYNTSNIKNNNELKKDQWPSILHTEYLFHGGFCRVSVDVLPLCWCDNLFGGEQWWQEDIMKVFTINKKIVKISVFFLPNTEIVASN